jgi:hypothetical protein
MVAFCLGLPIPDIDIIAHPLDDAHYSYYESFIYQGYWRIMFALPIAFAIL